MTALADFVQWLIDPTHWSGDFGIPNRVVEHIGMSVLAMVLAAVVALPAGLVIGHTRKAELLTVSLANIGRALPSFAVLGVLFPLTFELPGELGFWPTLVALWILAIPPIVTNTSVAIRSVDEATVEAARGMGMSELDLLRRIETPIGAPLIVTGLRIAAVQVVATATLWAVVAGGGLGRFILDGFATRDAGQTLGGAFLVAALAVLTEVVMGALERVATPSGSARTTPRGAFRGVIKPVDGFPAA